MNIIRLFLSSLAATLALLAAEASAQNKPAPPAAVTFKSLKEIVDVLPHPLVQQLKIKGRMEGAKDDANKIFMEKAVGKTATIKVRAQDWEPWSGPENNNDKTRITMVPATMNVLGTSFKIALWILIPPDQMAVLGKISKGGEITATGELTRFELALTPEGLKLNGDLRHAKLEK